jgi:hypothetical protein
MEQLVSNGKWNKDAVEYFPEDLGAIDRNQVMQRASVGNDDAAHLFGDAAETFKIRGEFLTLSGTKSRGVL